jgi:hypothetical protein
MPSRAWRGVRPHPAQGGDVGGEAGASLDCNGQGEQSLDEHWLLLHNNCAKSGFTT